METTVTAFDAVESEDRQIASMLLLADIAVSAGDISGMFEDGALVELGGRVIDDYEADLAERDDWERVVKRALERRFRGTAHLMSTIRC